MTPDPGVDTILVEIPVAMAAELVAEAASCLEEINSPLCDVIDAIISALDARIPREANQ